jgi:CubicO group peptidase (beta-lactamase class C family)
MKLRLFTLLTLLSLALVALGSAQAAPSPFQNSGDPQLDAVVEKARRQHNVPGASIAVLKNGELAWAKGYGMADPAQQLPVTPETVFNAASIAKPVTAWGIMKLVEDGLLDLDAPIEGYLTRWHLPPSEFDHDQTTIRRILSHTAGLSTDGDTGVEPGEYVPTLEEALDGAVLGMRALHVAYPPGEDYHYSSIGYTLLEVAVEEVTGEPFAVYMQREILDPLGMVNSAYDWTPELRAKAAVGHDWYNRPLPFYQYSTSAQGGLRTTASDLALFMAASMPGPNGEPVGRGVLTPDSVAEILTPVPFADEAESSHVTGLGYDLIRVDDTLVGARKTGDHRGFKPIIVMDLQEGEGIAIMANSDRAAIGFLMDIACAWSENVSGHPLRPDCGELRMMRNVQLIVAGVLALGALAYMAWVVSRIRAGRRRLGWDFSWGKVVRIELLLLVLVAWWVLWHTDTLLTRILHRYPCCGYAVTVRAVVPWPTAFVWISWAVTLWLLTWIAVTFAPRVRTDRAEGGRLGPQSGP